MTNAWRVTVAALVLPAILALGAMFAWGKAIYSFNFGDNALFFNFARWISHGEIFIRDFIHFRTPGPYYYMAAVQRIFGESFHSTAFALLLEAQVFQPLASFFLALAASRVLLGRASVAIALFSAATFLLMTPIFQVRTAVPTLALAAYVMTQLDAPGRLKQVWPALTGVFLGLTYWVGQEVFILLAFVVFCVELIARRDAIAARMTRLVIVGAVALAVIVAGIAALVAAGMPLGSYLYYTLPYALLIQPGGMDLPYPALSLDNLLYYVFFAEIALVAVLFVLSGLFSRPAALAFLSFAVLRMISALGRSDYLHLTFSISELVVLTPLAVALLPRLRVAPKRVAYAAVASILILGIFAAGILISSSALLTAPPLLCLIARMMAEDPRPLPPLPSWQGIAAGLTGAVAMVAVFWPMSYDSFRYGLDVAFSREPQGQLLGGVQFGYQPARELANVRAFLARHPHKTIFSFPVRPIYYAFADAHASRLTYFEPQTTVEEVAAVISDLKANPPDVVVQDVGQMLSTRPSLVPLADYLASNYHTEWLNRRFHVLELRVPRQTPRRTMRLIDRYSQLSAENPGAIDFSVRSPGDTLSTRLVIEAHGAVRHTLDVPPGWQFSAALDEREGHAGTAMVEMTRAGTSKRYMLKAGESQGELPLPEGEGPLTIVLHPGADGRKAGWIDPRFEAP
ncbi:hypothetical protein [Aurantimonas sp. VKM B-3413]|uniref:hypothetical protein n=1 Tax=Aurantimonas sp. VKM B-3413 TaxID=2779401 RepID=UPI001E554DA1|nr:hypothetical protein [Aurantimonas sp. VKM B-3413]MCB8839382.1 hypothetical protein [Aurantimonas sp. VKM B-3413]